MTASYVLKLACFSLATFFAVSFAASVLLTLLSSWAIRFAQRMQARTAARFLFALRIAPAALGIFAVFGLCIPSYLWFEPEAAAEQLGAVCIAASIATVVLWTRAVLSAGRALLKSHRLLQSSRFAGETKIVAGEPALVVRTARTTVLAGVFRPVLILSRDVLETLSPEQVEAAVRHERSHSISRDNLKRLAILLAPAFLPLARIEKAWRRYAEWAADDLAVAEDRPRSLALAEALVRVARLGAHTEVSPLVTSLLGEDLEARVDRLLNGEPPRQPLPWKSLALAMLAATAILLRPSTFDLVHRALETLIH
ncbi:MAG: hypothetical protein LAO79_02335 [Acidobacteriia bacterium]|nr:hypothetical protein [Terriglobia bacterium]